MAENNLDKALAYLGTSLQSLVQQANGPADLEHLHTKIAKRSLTGDHLNGGTIVNFASTGIKDEATSQQLVIKDSGLEIKAVKTDDVTAKKIVVDVLEVKELKAPIQQTKGNSLELEVSGGESMSGKGMMLKGYGPTKQFIFTANPDKFLSTENLELLKDKEFRINGNPVLTENSLGVSVTKSSLRELGRLKGLIVDGPVVLDQYIYYNNITSRLGLGTETPNAGLSVCENGVEVIIGTNDQSRGIIGTFGSNAFEIVTDSTSRISIGSSGNITFNSQEVVLNGKLAIGVRTRDPRVDLHVAGAIKYQDHIHQYLDGVPDNGTYTRGDIVWNNQPDLGKPVGWVCVRAGSPGTWLPFGDIKQSG